MPRWAFSRCNNFSFIENKISLSLLPCLLPWSKNTSNCRPGQVKKRLAVMYFKFPNANNNHIKQNAEDPPAAQIYYNSLGYLKFAARAIFFNVVQTKSTRPELSTFLRRRCIQPHYWTTRVDTSTINHVEKIPDWLPTMHERKFNV